jgi:C_GCAxxG_C_C family probable redox protein
MNGPETKELCVNQVKGAATETDSCAVVERCIEETEALFLSGSHHCAEAVVSVIRKHFSPETPELVVRLVSGLGGGCCSGCICGALSAATITFGMVQPDDKESVARLTRSVHTWFKETYGAACCRALQDKQGDGCRVSPGAVAGKIAELLLALEKA